MPRFGAGNRSVSKLVITICVAAILFLPSLSYGAPRGKSSVFSLFNLKEKSRFWSESVFRSEFDDLESSAHSNSGVVNYTKAGTIASYLELMEVDAVYLPVPVNFIFIGFDGKGNQDFKLLPEELERWFSKLDHVFEHTRVPHTKEVPNPFYKTNIEKELRHHLPIISRLNYNFSVHAIQMGEKVTQVIERAINVLARKDDVSRWAFIDLTAGPFSWGPSVGGEGVRTVLSLPNVGKTIGAVAEISEDEAEERLQVAIQDKFSVFGEKDHQAVDILLAEIDVYELFAFKHCKGRKVKLALCEELDERMRDLKIELQSLEGDAHDEVHQRKAMEALKRMESWNLFSDEHEEFQNYTVARDTFLAHLGATLWGSMRHIISPSVADGAFHHYEKISFQLVFITQEKVRQVKQLPVDLKALMDGLSSLLLPSQKPMFSQHMLTLSEDPALAMAFSVSRRAAAVPLLLVNGTYRKTVRSYLDSSILQYQLQRLNDHTSLKGGHAHSRATLEIPIFWLINGDPLLIDKHYQAKALSNMVVVVQSEASAWESHLQCNGRSLLWDLRSPVKAAMASVAEHLAGLLPLHLVYSVAHESAIEDWTWSVGCNPFSTTSQGWQISQFQSDTIARSYMITALEESIQAVNSGIHLLRLERTNEKSFKIFKSRERELMNKYKYVISLWRRLSNIAGETRYGDAMRFLYTLEEATSGFVREVNATVEVLHPIHCSKERKVKVEMDMTTVPAMLVVLILLYAAFKPRAPKPKIN
ncbi:uncharacterized protein LOC106426071 isoform X2 [Brassica napus]|uniref:uncharacterized protein LOC106426071 isoform X2 n=1 Tax=Brassica napus TaxID=3708 RepID=UPI0006AAE825|nr:uncharacterized protein LOC106426071 isoform X2 [Brassica napus]